MKKSSIIFIIILGSIVIGFNLWTAMLARKKSNELLTRFKEVDSSLQASTDSAKKSTATDTSIQFYPIYLLKSQSILLIDSLKEKLENIPESSHPNEISTQTKIGFKRLLNNIQQINKWKWTMVDSKIPDTLRYWGRADKFSGEKWLSLFDSSTKDETMIYLRHLRNEFISR